MKLEKYRNSVFQAIKRRKAFFLTKSLPDQAKQINDAKDSAQSSLVLKKLCQQGKVKTRMPTLKELNYYAKSWFHKDSHQEIILIKNEPFTH